MFQRTRKQHFLAKWDSSCLVCISVIGCINGQSTFAGLSFQLSFSSDYSWNKHIFLTILIFGSKPLLTSRWPLGWLSHKMYIPWWVWWGGIKRHFLFNGFPLMFTSNAGSFPIHLADFAFERLSLFFSSLLCTHLWSPPLSLLTTYKENGCFFHLKSDMSPSVIYFPDPRNWHWRAISSTGAHSRISQFPVTRVKRRHMGHLLTKWILEVQTHKICHFMPMQECNASFFCCSYVIFGGVSKEWLWPLTSSSTLHFGFHA